MSDAAPALDDRQTASKPPEHPNPTGDTALPSEELTPLSEARRALALRGTDPSRARRAAEWARARSTSGSEARGLAQRVLALLSLDSGDVDAARRHITAAVRTASRLPSGQNREGIYVSASGISMFAGRKQQSLAYIERAVAESGSNPSFDLEFQRTWVLGRAGRPEDAADAAQRLARRPDLSERDRADAWALESTLCLELGRYRAALDAAQRTIDFYAPGPPTLDLNSAYRNAALVLAALGELPKALHMLDQAERVAKELGNRVQTWTTIARAWTCLWGNLHEEAYLASELAWSFASRADLDTRAESGHILMRSALASGRTERALEIARLTKSMKARLGRSDGARSCELLLLEQRSGSKAGLRKLSESALLVDRGAQPNEIVAAHFSAFEAALRLDALTVAGVHRAAMLRHRSTLPALEQARVWLADSMWYAHTGKATSARRSVSTGLQVLRRHRAALGSTELRTAASASGEALAAIGLRLALGRGGGRQVLAASEAWRAQGSLRRGALSPEASMALDELRGVVAQMRITEVEEAAQRSLIRRQLELEERVRVLTRHAITDVGDETSPQLADALAVLGHRTLLSYVIVDGSLSAVAVQGGRCRLWRLRATAAMVANEQQKLAFSLRRLSRPGTPAPIRSAARAAAVRSLSALSELLITPITGLGDADEVVVVAPAPLHAVPWAALSTHAGTPLETTVSVVPSAMLLLQTSAVSTGPRVFCSGPLLAAADAEVTMAAALYPTATIIDERSTDNVLASLDGASIAHFACHGRLRADNPMFSALELHTGPLTVYDLERLTTTPDTMVLAACDSGVSAVRPGDELLGFTSALFAGGTRSVIASVIPVPDVATASLMGHVHSRLARGIAPARALTESRRLVHEESDQGFVTAIAFGNFGVR